MALRNSVIDEKECSFLASHKGWYSMETGSAVEITLSDGTRVYAATESIEKKYAEMKGLRCTKVRYAGNADEYSLGSRVATQAFPIMINGVPLRKMRKPVASNTRYHSFSIKGVY